MLEGCTEAAKQDRTIAQDDFTFTKANNFLLLKPMASHKPSNKVTPDEDLTWRQMSIAMTTLLHHMGRASWPDQYIMAITEFYLATPCDSKPTATPSSSIIKPRYIENGMRPSKAPTMSWPSISASSTTGGSTPSPPSCGMRGAQKGS